MYTRLIIVKRKLDTFIQTEQQRPYTDYQYYYVPESAVSAQQQMPLLRSPLAGQIQNSFAYGNFQIEPDGQIITPYYKSDQANQDSELSHQAKDHLNNIKQNLLPVLNGTAGVFRRSVGDSFVSFDDVKSLRYAASDLDTPTGEEKQLSKGKKGQAKEYLIQSLQKSPARHTICQSSGRFSHDLTISRTSKVRTSNQPYGNGKRRKTNV
jgi:hypothetical protein